jgi:energy-coupling factor transporter ATP-binding protein EcfA2
MEEGCRVPLVEIRHLNYTYPSSSRPVLADINLDVDDGEFILLTGPSGCGKTTLCRCFNGLIPHFYSGELTGRIEVAGLSVRDHSTSELSQHVGFVFQNPENQLFALSVEKDIAFGLENLAMPREEIRRRVDWAMDMVGITHLRDDPPYELSGGQQQRVAIASVLAMQPRLVVLDEPTSFLDPRSAHQLFKVLHHLNEHLDLAIVLVEHRLDLLGSYVSRVIVMDSGRIELDGTPRQVLSADETAILGIGIPKVTRLYNDLREEGFAFGRPPISVVELVQELRSVLRPDTG